MKIIELKELKKYHFRELVDLLELHPAHDHFAIETIIQKLLGLKILKKTRHSRSDQPEQTPLRECSYHFDYVGVFWIEHLCLFIYPKYISEDNIAADRQQHHVKFRQLIRVIQKFQHHQQLFDYELTDDTDFQTFNLLKFSLDFFEDYYIHELYHADETAYELNGSGLILWDQTIGIHSPYFTQHTPVYLDLVTTRTTTNEANIISQIHRCVLWECSARLRELLLVLDIEPIELTRQSLSNLGTTDYLAALLRAESSRQFVSWKQVLLQKLLNYVEQSETLQGSNQLTFIGSCAFRVIWKAVCAQVYNNDLDKTLNQLKLQVPDPVFSGETRLKELIPKPKWWPRQSFSDTLIPDIVSINRQSYQISIYDAKYYDYPHTMPGVQDLAKQWLYELAYYPLAQKNGLTIKLNALLFPTDQPRSTFEPEFVTWTLFHSLPDAKASSLNPIQIIYEEATKLYEAYLED